MYTDTEIPFCGTTLPRGTDIVVLTRYISKRSEDVPRGPQDSPPDVFDPCRYLAEDETGALTTVSPNNQLGGFLGFGHGVRACPGRTYTEALSYVILAAALQHFTWSVAPGHPAPRLVFDVVVTTDTDVPLVFARRTAAPPRRGAPAEA